MGHYSVSIPFKNSSLMIIYAKVLILNDSPFHAMILNENEPEKSYQATNKISSIKYQWCA